MPATNPIELKCLDAGPDCDGDVEYHMSLSGTGRAFPRCGYHWELNRDRWTSTYEPIMVWILVPRDVPVREAEIPATHRFHRYENCKGILARKEPFADYWHVGVDLLPPDQPACQFCFPELDTASQVANIRASLL